MDNVTWRELEEKRDQSPPISYREQQVILETLGIHVPDSAVASCVEIEDMDTAYKMLLEHVGLGEFDRKIATWSTTSSDVYAIIAESYNEMEMYADVFKGLQVIVQSEVSIHFLEQDDREVNWDDGDGSMLLSFSVNGTTYQYKVNFMGDWVDFKILDGVNEALRQEGIEKRFYNTSGMDGLVVFYRTEAWAREFQGTTLCLTSEKA